jgi:diguanylate cyclase (GGDEF)-like protein/PAS domain S-box-containing protein
VDDDRRRHAALVRLLLDLRSAEPLDRHDGAELILGAVCRYTGWAVGQEYRLDRRSGLLCRTTAVHEPEPGRYRQLLDAAGASGLGRGEDLPGAALASGTTEWTGDIALQARFRGVSPGVFGGLWAAVALPVSVNGAVEAVLEFFSLQLHPPDDDTLAVLSHVGAIWSRVLENERLGAEVEFRMHASASAHARDAIVVSTVGGAGRGPTILYANAAFSRMTGYSEAEVLGRSFSILAGARTNRATLQLVHHRLLRWEPVSAELIAYRKDGEEFLLEWHASPITETDGKVLHFASIQRDITRERSVELALERADRDALTGLPTRDVLDRRLRLAMARCRERPEYRFALLFLDLDGFKAVNDELGHVAGDQLLASASRRLEGAIRPGDVLARFGGDEFVILLQNVMGTAEVVMVAERVQERMRSPFEVQRRTLTMTVSIGIAFSDTGYSEPEEIIRDADAAMYEAKRERRGRLVFSQGRANGMAV